MRNFIFMLTCIPASAWAQETINYASLGGRVVDPAGATVDGAKVTARQTETNQSSDVTTDREGRFRFAYLHVGPYEITVSKQGFGDRVRGMQLTVGGAFDVLFALSVGEIQTTIEVTEVLEAARTQIASTMSRTEVADLPLSGRNYLDVALFVPGVSPTNTAANQLFAETSAIPSQRILSEASGTFRTASSLTASARTTTRQAWRARSSDWTWWMSFR